MGTELAKGDGMPDVADLAAAFEDESGLKEECVQQYLIVAGAVLTIGRRVLLICLNGQIRQ